MNEDLQIRSRAISYVDAQAKGGPPLANENEEYAIIVINTSSVLRTLGTQQCWSRV